MMDDYAQKRAVLAVSAFSALGMLAAVYSAKDFFVSAPLIVFYGVTVVNAYFSIRCFASITPKNYLQHLIDGLLAILYLSLLLFLNDVVNFLIISVFLFETAAMKYIFLLKIADIRYAGLIRRKILVDNLGAIACSLALVGAIKEYQLVSVYGLASIFVLANIYLLILKPFYKLPD